MPYQQSVDMLHAVIEEVEPPVGVSKTDVNDSKPLRKDRKNTTIVGEPSLGFECNGRQYIRLSDGELEQDLRAMREPDYRGFFHGFGDKVTYVIAVRVLQTYSYFDGIANNTLLSWRTRRTTGSSRGIAAKSSTECRCILPASASPGKLFRLLKSFSRYVEGAFYQLSGVDRSPQSYPDFYVYAAFRDWPADSTINNFALAGLRKVSRASVQIIFQYLPAPPPTSV